MFIKKEESNIKLLSWIIHSFKLVYVGLFKCCDWLLETLHTLDVIGERRHWGRGATGCDRAHLELKMSSAVGVEELFYEIFLNLGVTERNDRCLARRAWLGHPSIQATLSIAWEPSIIHELIKPSLCGVKPIISVFVQFDGANLHRFWHLQHPLADRSSVLALNASYNPYSIFTPDGIDYRLIDQKMSVNVL